MHSISGLRAFLGFAILSLIFFNSSLAIGKEAELVYQQTNIEISNGKMTESHFYEIRVNKREGDKYAEISIGFQKKNKVYDIEAAIFDRNGIEIRKLRKSDITEKSANSDVSFYTDSYVKEFSMRHNEYPYTLKYSYKLQCEQFWYIEDWLPILDYEIPTTRAVLHITTPKNYRISYHATNVNKCKIDSTAEQKFYTWEASFNAAFKSEKFSPPLSMFVPEVDVEPEHFFYEEEGFTRNWVDIGNWDQQLIKGLCDLTESEKLKVKDQVKDIKDTLNQIRQLFHYLQDVTPYINVSIKTGGHKPYPASYVAINKYGDCKALANYFLACLQEINVKAYYTLIHAGDVINKTETDFPSQQFNHVILFVPLASDTLWLDCTSDMAFGYLGTFTQNRLALVTEPDRSRFNLTPALTLKDVLEQKIIKANLTPGGDVKTDVKCIYRGKKYETLFYLHSNIKDARKQEYLNKYFVENGFELDTFSLALPNRDSTFMNLNYRASSNQQLKVYGKETLLKIGELEVPNIELPKARTLPVQVNYPIYSVDTLEYTVTNNYKILSIPANISVITKYGEYKTEFRNDNGKVKIYKSLKIFAGNYPLEEYGHFNSFINQVRENENSTYITLITL